jgi:REP element-mobilizing transposase RayT
MPRPRKRQVSLSDTPYYHCISRCVRRAFLCGKDPLTSFDFSHRRQWLVSRLKLVSEVFAVDLCAYAVMSNHYHVVVRIDRDRAQSWTAREVAERWTQLFAGAPLVQRWISGEVLQEAELNRAHAYTEQYRERMSDLSWFMRCVNEPVARLANAEDRCTGRFWEGRFKSQALLDERALLACMAYVDLNPIRASLAKTPEESNYTSIKERIEEPESDALMPFSESNEAQGSLPFRYRDYLELVDWSGRAIRDGKQGHIADNAPPILQRLGMMPESLLDYLQTRPESFHCALGPVSLMRQMAISLKLKFVRGMDVGRRLCPERS